MINRSNGIHARKLILEGNSLLNLAQNTNAVINGRYVTTVIYNGIKDTIKFYIDYSISSQTQTQINAAQSTRITPIANKGDILVIWEGTNDLFVDDNLSGASAFANLVTYLTNIPIGVKVIVGTIAARDHPSDTTDMMTRINDYNVLVRANLGTYGYTICDIAADPAFDTKADASNTTYYLSDKTHFTTAGQDLIASLFITSIIARY